MTYLIVSVIVFVMMYLLDKINGEDMFMTNHMKMIRVGMSFIWPITLLLLIDKYSSGRDY
jgi:hypothetical protein